MPLITSSQINTFKWLDWTQTIKLPYRPTVLGSSSLRECLRDKGLYVYGEKYHLPDADVNYAVSYFKKQRELKNKRWWSHYHDMTRLALYRIPNKGIQIIEQASKLNLDNRFIDSAANILMSARQQPGFLSQDNQFNHNLERLLVGIDTLSKCK